MIEDKFIEINESDWVSFIKNAEFFAKLEIKKIINK